MINFAVINLKNLIRNIIKIAIILSFTIGINSLTVTKDTNIITIDIIIKSIFLFFIFSSLFIKYYIILSYNLECSQDYLFCEQATNY